MSHPTKLRQGPRGTPRSLVGAKVILVLWAAWPLSGGGGQAFGAARRAATNDRNGDADFQEDVRNTTGQSLGLLNRQFRQDVGTIATCEWTDLGSTDSDVAYVEQQIPIIHIGWELVEDVRTRHGYGYRAENIEPLLRLIVAHEYGHVIQDYCFTDLDFGQPGGNSKKELQAIAFATAWLNYWTPLGRDMDTVCSFLSSDAMNREYGRSKQGAASLTSFEIQKFAFEGKKLTETESGPHEFPLKKIHELYYFDPFKVQFQELANLRSAAAEALGVVKSAQSPSGRKGPESGEPSVEAALSHLEQRGGDSANASAERLGAIFPGVDPRICRAEELLAETHETWDRTKDPKATEIPLAKAVATLDEVAQAGARPGVLPYAEVPLPNFARLGFFPAKEERAPAKGENYGTKMEDAREVVETYRNGLERFRDSAEAFGTEANQRADALERQEEQGRISKEELSRISGEVNAQKQRYEKALGSYKQGMDHYYGAIDSYHENSSAPTGPLGTGSAR